MTKHQKMKAIDFIKENGIDKARDVVEGAPAICTYFEEYPLGVRYYRSDIGFNVAIKISELNRLVESVDLIGKYHSIDHAKNHYNNLRKAINQYENKDIGYLANELEQAITDYEAIYCVESIIEKREFDFGLAHDDEYVKTGDSNE